MEILVSDSDDTSFVWASVEFLQPPGVRDLTCMFKHTKQVISERQFVE